jgi:hypothetical protein
MDIPPLASGCHLCRGMLRRHLAGLRRLSWCCRKWSDVGVLGFSTCYRLVSYIHRLGHNDDFWGPFKCRIFTAAPSASLIGIDLVYRRPFAPGIICTRCGITCESTSTRGAADSHSSHIPHNRDSTRDWCTRRGTWLERVSPSSFAAQSNPRDLRTDYERTLGLLARPCLFLSRHAPGAHFSSGVFRCGCCLWCLFKLDLQQDQWVRRWNHVGAFFIQHRPSPRRSPIRQRFVVESRHNSLRARLLESCCALTIFGPFRPRIS